MRKQNRLKLVPQFLNAGLPVSVLCMGLVALTGCSEYRGFEENADLLLQDYRNAVEETQQRWLQSLGLGMQTLAAVELMGDEPNWESVTLHLSDFVRPLGDGVRAVEVGIEEDGRLKPVSASYWDSNELVLRYFDNAGPVPENIAEKFSRHDHGFTLGGGDDSVRCVITVFYKQDALDSMAREIRENYIILYPNQ